MSLQSLVSELQSLRRDLSELSARVLALENQVTSTTEARFTTPPASPLVINYTGLSSPIPQSPYPETGSAAAELPSFPTSSVATPATGASGGTNLTEAERVQLARDAGGFLRLCLTGEQRGTSGRDRLRLSSKVYVLFRDIQGTLHNPVLVFHSFASIRPRVKRGENLGQSIFIGWPTTWEARHCTLAAGFNWPADES